MIIFATCIFSPKDETRNRGACSNLFFVSKKTVERKLSSNFKVNFNIVWKSAIKKKDASSEKTVRFLAQTESRQAKICSYTLIIYLSWK